MQPFIGRVVERLPVDRQRADVVHDFAAEVIFAAVGNIDLFLDRSHQPFIRLVVLPRELILDLFPLRVGFDVVDVVCAKPFQRIFIGRDGPLHFILYDVLVFLFHNLQQLAIFVPQFVAGQQRMMFQPRFQLIQHHERVDRLGIGMSDQGVGNLVLDIAGRDALHALVGRLFA